MYDIALDKTSQLASCSQFQRRGRGCTEEALSRTVDVNQV